MGLFNFSALSDMNNVKNLRKDTFQKRDALRGTPQFGAMFYALIGDPEHPPCFIEGDLSGTFWTQAWEADSGRYEPLKTQKLSDSDLGYTEGCAIYLLIQECYPNVYDFPPNTIRALESGATIKLQMRKEYQGKAIKPAALPPRPAAPAAPAAAGAGQAFCPHCGAPHAAGAKFCAGCGAKL